MNSAPRARPIRSRPNGTACFFVPTISSFQRNGLFLRPNGTAYRSPARSAGSGTGEMTASQRDALCVWRQHSRLGSELSRDGFRVRPIRHRHSDTRSWGRHRRTPHEVSRWETRPSSPLPPGTSCRAFISRPVGTKNPPVPDPSLPRSFGVRRKPDAPLHAKRKGRTPRGRPALERRGNRGDQSRLMNRRSTYQNMVAMLAKSESAAATCWPGA
jgi:hypothetical protein